MSTLESLTITILIEILIIILVIFRRIKMNNKLLEIEEKVKNGDFDDNELIDLVLYLERENQALLEENQKYKEVIDELNDLLIIKKARCLNEDNYVLNIPDLDDILQVLKEVE